MQIGLGVVILQGCTPLVNSLTRYDSCSTNYDYEISLIGAYDLTGHSDSYFQFQCPTILSYGTLKIEGSDIKPIIKKPEPNYSDLPCCLPF